MGPSYVTSDTAFDPWSDSESDEDDAKKAKPEVLKKHKHQKQSKHGTSDCGDAETAK